MKIAMNERNCFCFCVATSLVYVVEIKKIFALSLSLSLSPFLSLIISFIVVCFSSWTYAREFYANSHSSLIYSLSLSVWDCVCVLCALLPPFISLTRVQLSNYYYYHTTTRTHTIINFLSLFFFVRSLSLSFLLKRDLLCRFICIIYIYPI